jgi:hypothetical protein
VADAATIRYTSEAIAAPVNGAAMNSQSWLKAHPPTKTAGPILRAGLTDVFVTGIPTRWISTSTIPIGIPTKPTGALISVVPNTVKTRKNVKNHFCDECGRQIVTTGRMSAITISRESRDGRIVTGNGSPRDDQQNAAGDYRASDLRNVHIPEHASLQIYR